MPAPATQRQSQEALRAGGRLGAEQCRRAYGAADALADRREDVQARKHYEKATQCDKHHLGAWLNYGVFLKEKRELRNAAKCFKNAVMIDPKSSLARYNLARALFETREFRAASEAFVKFVEMEPNFADGHYSLGLTQELAGDNDNAIKSFEAALKLEPGLARAYFRIGNVHQVLGRFDEAETFFRKAIDINPSFARSYAALAVANRFESDEDIEEILEHIGSELEREDLDPGSRMDYHSAASRIFERQKKFDEAFHHYRLYNELRDAAMDDTEQTERDRFDGMKAVSSRSFIEERMASGSSTDQPIFIVGMPRSGTTLTEQILASHPNVYGAGELFNLEEALIANARKASSSARYPDFMNHLTDKQISYIAEQYLERYPDDAKGYPRVTDKLPNNFRMLGLINIVLPNAKVIYCRRNAVDNCLSCYLQNFADDIWYSFNLEKLARAYRMHLDLMDHWRTVLPNPFFEVRYEELTDNPEPIVRETLAFCDLEWDDACLNFHETERAVRTASIWQVRQPMYKTSVAKWKQYEKHLGPLIEGLGEHAFT